jgi:hypothetical protein
MIETPYPEVRVECIAYEVYPRNHSEDVSSNKLESYRHIPAILWRCCNLKCLYQPLFIPVTQDVGTVMQFLENSKYRNLSVKLLQYT